MSVQQDSQPAVPTHTGTCTSWAWSFIFCTRIQRPPVVLAKSSSTSVANREIQDLQDEVLHQDIDPVQCIRAIPLFWGPRPDTTEILHVTLPLPSARAFFEHFIADTAKMSMLDAVLPPIDDRIPPNTAGLLEAWNAQHRREMYFKTWTPNPVFPLSRVTCAIKQVQDFRWHEGCLQYQSRGRTVECNYPYAGCFYIRVIWTVRPVPAPAATVDAGGSEACELSVTCDVNFFGAEPVIAAVIRPRSIAKTQESIQAWIGGARSFLASSSSSSMPGLAHYAASARAAPLPEKPKASFASNQTCPWSFVAAAIVACLAILVFLALRELIPLDILRQPLWLV